MELLKLLSANEIVAQIVCFLLLLSILRVFLWKRFLALLDDRKENIASQFKKLEDTRAGMENAKSAYEDKIINIEKEARAKVQEAIIEGKKFAEEIRKKAEVDGERIIESAKDNIKIEIAKARQELKDEIVELTINAAEKVIEANLSEEDDKRIVEDFLKRLDSNQ